MTNAAPRRTRARTPASDLAAVARRACADAPPNFAQYRDVPVTFARDVLGFEPWSGQQDIANAVAQHDLVTCSSGHGIGKSAVAATLALWFWSTRGPGARVILIAPTARQVHEVIWREVRQLYRTARVPIGGQLGMLASTGLRSNDARELFGVAPDSPVALQGIRAPEMLVIVDESSGVSDDVFEAIQSLIAGGGKLLLLGNPLSTKPPFSFFYRSHRSNDFHRLQISSTSTPNVIAGERVVPGLVTADWIRQRLADWGGTDHPLYKIKILGQFVEDVEGSLFPHALIADAQAMYEDTPATGRLVIAIDPAGASGKGDDSGFVARRGKRVLEVAPKRGLDEAAHVAEVRAIIARHRGSADKPLVVVDRDGYVGAKVYGELVAQARDAFDVVGLRTGERARRRPQDFHNVRAEMYYALLDALRDGLALPINPRLEGELAVIKGEQHYAGRALVSDKDALRKALGGKSPDLADALAMAVYVRDSYAGPVASDHDAPPCEHDPWRVTDRLVSRGGTFDPYAAQDAFRR